MKPVVFSIKPTPSYLTFLPCICGINWKNPYSEQFESFLAHSDRTFLVDHATKLTFGDGDGDHFVELFYFLPAHIGFEQDKRTIEYFQVLGHCASQNNMTQLFVRFQTHISEISQFYPGFMKSFEGTLTHESFAQIHNLAAIYQRNYEPFLNRVWFPVCQDLDNDRFEVETLFKGKDIIGDWEHLTGFTFQADAYHIALIPYLINGPQANSLSYDKNLFPLGTDQGTLDYYQFFVSHEIGTHILKKHTFDQFHSEDAETNSVAYIAMENIARYYNLKILPASRRYTLSEEFYHDSVFEQIFETLEKEYPGDIEKQYLEAITRFMNSTRDEVRSSK